MAAKRYSILVVDDEPDNLALLERVLRREYTIFCANSGAEALELLDNAEVDMIISDQRMPNMTGAELLGEAYTRNPNQVRILLTAYSDVKDIIQAINAGHIYQYVGKPWDPDELKLIVRRALEAYQLHLDNRRMLTEYRSDEAMLLSCMASWVQHLEARVPHLMGHAKRTKDLASALGRELKLFSEELAQLEAAAYLRMVGVVAQPDRLLLADPADLAPADREQLAGAHQLSEEILLPLPFFQRATHVVAHLDERWDGTGSPRQVAGEAIPLMARILALAIELDRRIQGVPGQVAMAPLAAAQSLQGEAGRFDPNLAAKLVELIAANPDAIACPR